MEFGTSVLAVQGGGARAAYSFGAAAALWNSRNRPRYDSVVASSAGAIAMAYVLAGQADQVPSLFLSAFGSSDLISYKRPNRIADVDALIHRQVRQQFPLDLGAVRSADERFLIQLTDATTARPAHLDLADLSDSEAWDALVASAAIPGLYETPAYVAGKRYVDGGVTDPIPLRTMFEAGTQHVTAIWTRPIRSDMPPQSLPIRLFSRLIFRSQSSAVRSVLSNGDSSYDDAISICRDGDERVRFIAPAAASEIAARLTKDPKVFWDSVRLGVSDLYGLYPETQGTLEIGGRKIEPQPRAIA